MSGTGRHPRRLNATVDAKRDLSLRLRGLAGQTPNPVLRQEIDDGLHSKWEGVQSCAAQTLQAWGDAESLRRLLSWLECALHLPHDSALHFLASRMVHEYPGGIPWSWFAAQYRRLRPKRRIYLISTLVRFPETDWRTLLDQVQADRSERRQAEGTWRWQNGRYGQGPDTWES